MKRYIDMVIGLFVIIVIITPFIKLIHKDFQVDKEVFRHTIEQSNIEYKDDLELASLQEKQVKDIYLSKMKDEIRELIYQSTEYEVEEMKISICEDKINYGKVNNIEIILRENKDNHQTASDSITTVQIEEVNINDKKEIPIKLEEFDDSEYIKDILNRNYNISKEDIKIFLSTLKEGE